jgi:hypothetical protein
VPAPTNLGFETAGAGAGNAQGWSILSRSDSRLVCMFMTEPQIFGPINPPNDPQAAWPDQTNVLVTNNDIAAPDGTMTAAKVRDDAVNGLHWVNSRSIPTTIPAGTYHFGAFFKGGTHGCFGPRMSLNGNVFKVCPDISSGNANQIEFVSAPAGSVSAVNGSMVDLGTGWLLVTMSIKVDTDTPNCFSGFALYSNAITGTDSYAGALEYDYIWNQFVYNGDLADVEAFDGWFASYLYGITIGVNGLRVAWDNGTVVTSGFEGFEGGWGNTPFLVAVTGVDAVWNATADTIEAFEREWDNNDHYMLTISGGVAMTVVDTGAVEAFEDGWSNDAWAASLPGPVTGTFSGVGDTFDGFEHVRPDREYTADFTTDTLTSSAHGFVNGDVILFVNVGGAFPGGLIGTLEYAVMNVAANTFQVTITGGPPAFNITDNGTGTQIARGSPRGYWNGPDINPTM